MRSSIQILLGSLVLYEIGGHIRNVGTSKWLKFQGLEGAEESNNGFGRTFRVAAERLLICILELNIRLQRDV
ncbi:MAG: hypothetical protein QF426_12270 [Verrucomicrobiales bacterium]|nr:hypothetical protein [Verrucomicrobiales bacterium]